MPRARLSPSPPRSPIPVRLVTRPERRMVSGDRVRAWVPALPSGSVAGGRAEAPGGAPRGRCGVTSGLAGPPPGEGYGTTGLVSPWCQMRRHRWRRTIRDAHRWLGEAASSACDGPPQRLVIVAGRGEDHAVIHSCAAAPRASHRVRYTLCATASMTAVQPEHRMVRSVLAHGVRGESPHCVRSYTLARRLSEHGNVRFASRHRTRYHRLDMAPATHGRGNGDG